MRRALVPIAATGVLLAGLLGSPAIAEPKPGASADRIEVFTGEVSAQQLERIKALGVDHEDLQQKQAGNGKVKVSVTITGAQARKLAASGIKLSVKKVDGKTLSQRADQRAKEGLKVFRPYSGAGNLHEEIVKLAKDNPTIAQRVDIGKSLNGKPITAIRVTKNPGAGNGKKPAVVYWGAQHAREWITPEMIRRLAHHFVGNYGKNAEITKLVDTNVFYFIPVVNVDGYDHTFTPGNRMWRKNLRDNNGDGKITAGEGVDLNRNMPYKWGYDNQGSSPDPVSAVYRGKAPASEPETRAQISFVKKVRPKFLINYHSAAELLLYGVGWQAQTSSPDDVISKAMLGNIDKPAVPGYLPQLSAQLYTTNGDTDGEMDHHGAVSHTPEMTTCEVASDIDPDDEWKPEDCGSGFHFPDDEKLIQGEFSKNIPYVLSVAKSAKNPAKPASSVGQNAPDFKVDKFGTSYGKKTQKAASIIRKSLKSKRMHYKIGSGRTKSTSVARWRGGERYGKDGTTYFAEYRGTVRGQKPGKKVTVWFSGLDKGKRVKSEAFSYKVKSKGKASVLIVANEDYKGVNPTYPVKKLKYASQYTKALTASGVKSKIWDVDKSGAPHDMGVLKHFKGVVWYLGDNRLTQDAADEPTQIGDEKVPDSTVADRAYELTMAVREYLNEGGKLLYTGETTAYYGPLGEQNLGIYYGSYDHPERPCKPAEAPCDLVSSDFTRYYLGVFDRVPLKDPDAFIGSKPFSGIGGNLDGAASNPVNEAGGLEVTSTNLPAKNFPLFKSWKAGNYAGVKGPYAPYSGKWAAVTRHSDNAYTRLTRTIDLTNVSADKKPSLDAQMSINTEATYDYSFVEAREDGKDDWTTLADSSGGTKQATPDGCADETHPQLRHYLSAGDGGCKPKGSTGEWNAVDGSTGGWKKYSFDLSKYAGKKVEVSFAYMSDGGTGGKGMLVDDVKLSTEDKTEDFESGLGEWKIGKAPEGSPGNAIEFARTGAVIDSVAAVATNDTVTFGFGLEQINGQGTRNKIMRQAVRHLLK